jgi:hypothetical protein
MMFAECNLLPTSGESFGRVMSMRGKLERVRWPARLAEGRLPHPQPWDLAGFDIVVNAISNVKRLMGTFAVNDETLWLAAG